MDVLSKPIPYPRHNVIGSEVNKSCCPITEHPLWTGNTSVITGGEIGVLFEEFISVLDLFVFDLCHQLVHSIGVDIHGTEGDTGVVGVVGVVGP